MQKFNNDRKIPFLARDYLPNEIWIKSKKLKAKPSRKKYPKTFTIINFFVYHTTKEYHKKNKDKVQRKMIGNTCISVSN